MFPHGRSESSYRYPISWTTALITVTGGNSKRNDEGASNSVIAVASRRYVLSIETRTPYRKLTLVDIA